MNRDWDVVRKILLAVEAQQTATGRVEPTSIQGYDEENVVYHMKIMDEAGLIETWSSMIHNSAPYMAALSMTWKGHEFLDQIRQDTVWNRVKGGAREKGLDLSIDVIGELAKTIIFSMLKT